MRLIDEHRLIEELNEAQVEGDDLYKGLGKAKAIVCYQPTIDAVEVVRCKDCVYAKPFNAIWRLPKRNTLICTLNDGAEVAENDFCSFARRKENGK